MVKNEIMTIKKMCELILKNQDDMKCELLEALDGLTNNLESNFDILVKEMNLGFGDVNRTLDFWINKIDNSPKFSKRLASI